MAGKDLPPLHLYTKPRTTDRNVKKKRVEILKSAMPMAVQLTKMSPFSFSRGDLVWVRSPPSSSWEPALFLRKESDNQHLVMSFALDPPKYFSLPNICPFDDISRAHSTENDPVLLKSALIYFAARVGSSLECPCTDEGKREKMREMNGHGAWNFDDAIVKERDLFDPSQILRFVSRLAVRPWIEDEDLVCGIRGAEQVKGFRRMASREPFTEIWQEIIDSLPEHLTQFSDISSESLRSSSTSTEGESLTAEVEDECQGSYLDIAQNGASDSHVSLEDNLKSDTGIGQVLDLGCHNHKEGDVHHLTDRQDAADCSLAMVQRSNMVLYSNELQFLHKKLMNLHHLAVDHCFLEGESLKTLKSDVLKYRSWSQRNGNLVLLEKCSSGRKLEYLSTSFGYDSGFKSQSPDAAFHRMKRQLSHCHVFTPLKLQKTLLSGTDGSSRLRIKSLCDKDFPDSFFLDPLSKHQDLSIKEADIKADPIHSFIVPSGVGSLFTTAIANRPDSVCVPTGCSGAEIVPVSSTFHKSLQVSKDGKTLHQSTSSNLSSLPERGASKLQGDSTSLIMKFPEDFHLPSKDELVKKFTRFGAVDVLNSNIYPSSGSARVVFFKQIDAVAAYHYAKRSKVLGPAKIRFWLDPSQYGRKAKKPQAHSSEAQVTPCLRKPSSPEDKARKKCKQVRFSS